MSYISDWLHSEQTEDDYRTYCWAASREDAMEREAWEREMYDDELVIDNDFYDESEGE